MNTMGAIHAALCARDIDKEDARDRFERVTGKRSLKAMSEAQRHKVLDDLNADGRKPASKARRKVLSGPYAKKLQALWIAGWNLGLVRNRDDKALLAFVKRQTGLEHTQFLHDAENAAKVIEALKGWLAREGGVDWADDSSLPAYARTNGFKIAMAQCAALYPDELWATDLMVKINVIAQRAADVDDLSELVEDKHWIPIMNELGRRVRDDKKAAA